MVRSERYAMIVRGGVVAAFLPAVNAMGERVAANTYAPAVLAALHDVYYLHRCTAASEASSVVSL